MLPISMGFGVMTGLGPVAGLHGSIAVGLFSAIFSGTRGLIVGPNIFAVIAMAIIVTKYTTTIGEALTAAMLAGVIQIILGMLKFGRYMSYMPYSLLAGFFYCCRNSPHTDPNHACFRSGANERRCCR